MFRSLPFRQKCQLNLNTTIHLPTSHNINTISPTLTNFRRHLTMLIKSPSTLTSHQQYSQYHQRQQSIKHFSTSIRTHSHSLNMNHSSSYHRYNPNLYQFTKRSLSTPTHLKPQHQLSRIKHSTSTPLRYFSSTNPTRSTIPYFPSSLPPTAINEQLTQPIPNLRASIFKQLTLLFKITTFSIGTIAILLYICRFTYHKARLYFFLRLITTPESFATYLQNNQLDELYANVYGLDMNKFNELQELQMKVDENKYNDDGVDMGDGQYEWYIPPQQGELLRRYITTFPPGHIAYPLFHKMNNENDNINNTQTITINDISYDNYQLLILRQGLELIKIRQKLIDGIIYLSRLELKLKQHEQSTLTTSTTSTTPFPKDIRLSLLSTKDTLEKQLKSTDSILLPLLFDFGTKEYKNMKLYNPIDILRFQSFEPQKLFTTLSTLAQIMIETRSQLQEARFIALFSQSMLNQQWYETTPNYYQSLDFMKKYASSIEDIGLHSKNNIPNKEFLWPLPTSLYSYDIIETDKLGVNEPYQHQGALYDDVITNVLQQTTQDNNNTTNNVQNQIPIDDIQRPCIVIPAWSSLPRIKPNELLHPELEEKQYNQYNQYNQHNKPNQDISEDELALTMPEIDEVIDIQNIPPPLIYFSYIDKHTLHNGSFQPTLHVSRQMIPTRIIDTNHNSTNKFHGFDTNELTFLTTDEIDDMILTTQEYGPKIRLQTKLYKEKALKEHIINSLMDGKIING